MRTAILSIVAAVMMTASLPTAATALTPQRHAVADPSPSPSPVGGNQADAMTAVGRYEQAFAYQDCDLFVAATTPAFRENVAMTDCETFLDRARGRAAVIESLEMTPVSASGTGRGTLAALVHLEVRSHLDENGRPAESPVSLDYDYRYHLVRADGAWKVDVVHDVSGGRVEGQVSDVEQQAVDRMMVDWRTAYTTGDCAAVEASTTAGYRDSMGWTDCASFEQYIADQNAYCPMDVHQEDIRYRTLIDPHVGEIIIDVVEVCTLDTDESGAPIDPPYEAGAPYRYHLVEADGAWRIAEGDNGAAAEDEPGNANERAAIEAIRGYNQAWLDADCETYLATTTEAFRTALNAGGCAAFGPAARTYAESVTNFAVTPTDIERPSSKTMEIKTHETYDSLADVNGDPVDAPFLVDEYWVYTLVLSDGSWMITDVVMLL